MQRTEIVIAVVIVHFTSIFVLYISEFVQALKTKTEVSKMFARHTNLFNNWSVSWPGASWLECEYPGNFTKF